MECLVNKVPAACIQLCKKKVRLDLTITNDLVRMKKQLMCYRGYEVPRILYGAQECINYNPNEAFPLNYVICLKTNGVPVD